LAAHNPEINWETGEVKMMRFLTLCGRNREKKEKRELRKERREQEAIRWAADEKEDWGKEEEMEMDHKKIEGMVPKKFH